GDYVGAKEAWEFAASLSDKDPVLFSNLGNLYGYYLKNNLLAEVDFLKSIKLEPMTANWYLRTADFYREVEQDLEKARNILNEGLQKIPNDPSLEQALKQLN